MSKPTTNNPLTRRNFLKTSAATGAGAVVAPNILIADHHGKQKLRIAHVGTGGRAGAHINMAAGEGCICNTYCDVDTRRWGAAQKKWPEAKGYQSYLEMFEKEKDNFDAVSIASQLRAAFQGKTAKEIQVKCERD